MLRRDDLHPIAAGREATADAPLSVAPLERLAPLVRQRSERPRLLEPPPSSVDDAEGQRLARQQLEGDLPLEFPGTPLGEEAVSNDPQRRRRRGGTLDDEASVGAGDRVVGRQIALERDRGAGDRSASGVHDASANRDEAGKRKVDHLPPLGHRELDARPRARVARSAHRQAIRPRLEPLGHEDTGLGALRFGNRGGPLGAGRGATERAQGGAYHRLPALAIHHAKDHLRPVKGEGKAASLHGRLYPALITGGAFARAKDASGAAKGRQREAAGTIGLSRRDDLGAVHHLDPRARGGLSSLEHLSANSPGTSVRCDEQRREEQR